MIWKIILSVALGFLIGLEREQHGKAVGIRTMSLITLGSTLFCLIAVSNNTNDYSRITAQIVSGIGFLGAGIIFKDNNHIQGLTTAATIWTTAAVGCLVGMGFYFEAIFGTIIILIINLFFKYIKINEFKRFKKFKRK